MTTAVGRAAVTPTAAVTTIPEAVVEVAATLPAGWSITPLVTRSFKYRNQYTVVAYRDGQPMASWPGIYDVKRALPVVVAWITRQP